MKYIFIFFLLTFTFASQLFANTPTATATIASIKETMESLAKSGAFGQDVANERTNYYSDQLYIYGSGIEDIIKSSDYWIRNTLSSIIKKRLSTLKDQGFLTPTQYDTEFQSYKTKIDAARSSKLVEIYNDFLTQEQSIIYKDTKIAQDSLFEEMKTKIGTLLSERKITKEKHDTWIVKVSTQIYEHKSEADFVRTLFEDEAVFYSGVLLPEPVKSSPVTVDKTVYYEKVKKQNLVRYQKLPQKSLRSQIERTKKLMKRQKKDSKAYSTSEATLKLLEEVLLEKTKTTITLKVQ